MYPNRQNNCTMGRQGGRPVTVIGNPVCNNPVSAVPCCSDVSNTQAVPCCSDVAVGGIIIGGGSQGCDKETVLSGLPIAMAYVPWQSYGNIYPLQQALQNGTMFRELDLEFAGRRCN